METLVALLIVLIVACVVVWIIRTIPFPPEAAWIRSVLLLVAGLIFLFWLLAWTGVLDIGVPYRRHWF